MGFTARQWQGKFFRCGMRCYYCHKPLLIEEAEKEHQLPISRGGSDSIDNVVPACKDCNRRKGTRTDEEFKAAFSKALELLTATNNPMSEMNLAQRDERDIFALRKENESVSWAWRNPY
jgi:hypothetical protein